MHAVKLWNYKTVKLTEIDPSPTLPSYCCYATCQAFTPGTSVLVCMHRCHTFPRR